MSRLLPREIREPAALVANARSLTEVFGLVHCNDDGMNFKLFYDPGCGNPVVPPQDFLISYQLEGWNMYPWNFDIKWDTCYALNAQHNIFIRVTSAFGLKAAFAAVSLALTSYLFWVRRIASHQKTSSTIVRDRQRAATHILDRPIESTTNCFNFISVKE